MLYSKDASMDKQPYTVGSAYQLQDHCEYHKLSIITLDLDSADLILMQIHHRSFLKTEPG